MTVQPPRIVHLHIPKTAGTSLKVALREHYDPSRCFPAVYETEFASVNPRDYDLFSAHIGFELASSLQASIICLLRDPVDRFISVYYYWRRLVATENRTEVGPVAASSLSLEEFVERFDEPGLTEEFYNRATWQLALSHQLIRRRENIAMTRSELLTKAKENLGKCDVVGRVENMPEFVRQLKEKLGVSLSVDRYNVTSRPSVAEVPLSTRRRIADWLQLDLELYWSTFQ